MSIESDIKHIRKQVDAILAIMEQPQTSVTETPAETTSPAQEAPPPAPAATPEPAAGAIPGLGGMGFAPQETPATPTIEVPFTDTQGLTKYTLESYNALAAIDPKKAAGIQTVMTGLGYENINHIKPEHFAAYYEGVEKLKE